MTQFTSRQSEPDRSAARRSPGGLVRATYGLYAWMMLLALGTGTTLLVAFAPGRERRRRIARAGARLVFRLIGVRLEVTGTEHIDHHPSVVVANHASYLDGIVLTAALPPSFGFVIKREIVSVPGVHFLLRRIGSHFVERHQAPARNRDARRLVRLAVDGESLAFFPEGTFDARPGLKPFKAGAFTAAVRASVPVIPVVIRGAREMLPSGRWLPAPGELSVTVTPPIYPVAGDVRALQREARQRMLAHLDEPDLGPD